ncbi:MAG: 3'(2'), 5'-bisphosphate nucleotidase [Candidatus Omnitrophota bacterium]
MRAALRFLRLFIPCFNMDKKNQNISNLLWAVQMISESAGRGIMQYYPKPIKVTQKSDASPLTLADLLAHDIIHANLKMLTPNIPVISEESKVAEYAVRKKWKTYWLIDPLDGTKEFIKKTRDFTVNIALMQNQQPILGAVHAPARGITYLGERTSAWKFTQAKGLQRIRCSKPTQKSKLRIVLSVSHAGSENNNATRQANIAWKSVGSSLKFCALAEGSADLYVRHAPTMEWDTAAGDCIWRCAGLHAKKNISPIKYGKKTLKNGGFVFGPDLAIKRWNKLLTAGGS